MNNKEECQHTETLGGLDSLGVSSCLARADFGQFALREGVEALKGLVFNEFLFGRMLWSSKD